MNKREKLEHRRAQRRTSYHRCKNRGPIDLNPSLDNQIGTLEELLEKLHAMKQAAKKLRAEVKYVASRIAG